MKTNPLRQMQNYGHSIWIDDLTRDAIETGELNRLIENFGLRGLTSNPAIFEKAITGSDRYDQAIQSGHEQGKSSQEIYESLVFEDIRKACDIFHPIYEESDRLDGYVSIEVSPHLVRDIKGTIAEAIHFHKAIDRENVMIKIPGTLEGCAAIEQLISRGINVNVTLLFSGDNYQQAALAYLRGLETRVNNNKPIDNIASVASFYISRLDTKVDQQIEQKIRELSTESIEKSIRLRQLRGKVAVANATIAYQTFKDMISSQRWQALEKKGAKYQRLLWASTSSKNPDYSDVKYVNELVGKYTVNTLPLITLEACADHCELNPKPIENNIGDAYQVFESLQHPDIKINIDEILDELLEEGIEKFVNPYDFLLKSIENQAKKSAVIAD